MSGAASRICAICGAGVPAPFRAPAAELAPDLDMRPGEPARSTLSRWIATCRGCGASGPDLAVLPETAGATIRSDAYQALRTPKDPPPRGMGPAMPPLRWALICQDAGRLHDAAEATLAAAWALDDAVASAADPHPDLPTELRRRAASLWGEPDSTESALRLLDIQRRAGDFETARALAIRLDTGVLDESSRAVLLYQTRLIEARDTTRHMLSSALRPPARTPHVTHGRVEQKGLFGRLFGRK